MPNGSILVTKSSCVPPSVFLNALGVARFVDVVEAAMKMFPLESSVRQSSAAESAPFPAIRSAQSSVPDGETSPAPT